MPGPSARCYRGAMSRRVVCISHATAAGGEAAVEKRLRAFADAGATDVSVRVLPIGENRDELLASMHRTRAFVASLATASVR